MHTNGYHTILDIWEVDSKKLDNLAFLEQTFVNAANEANNTILNVFFHKFEPIGVTGVVTIAESHISVHTWPEEGYASVDIYTCGSESFPEKAVTHIINELNPNKIYAVKCKRGLVEGIKIRRSTSEVTK